jgi:hypothetical protein
MFMLVIKNEENKIFSFRLNMKKKRASIYKVNRLAFSLVIINPCLTTQKNKFFLIFFIHSRFIYFTRRISCLVLI